MTSITALGNLINLTKTQTMYSQLQAFPPYESSLLMGQLSAGGAIMNEFKNYTSHQLCLLFLSALIIICGILYKIWFYKGENSLEDAEDVSNQPENKQALVRNDTSATQKSFNHAVKYMSTARSSQ